MSTLCTFWISILADLVTEGLLYGCFLQFLLIGKDWIERSPCYYLWHVQRFRVFWRLLGCKLLKAQVQNHATQLCHTFTGSSSLHCYWKDKFERSKGWQRRQKSQFFFCHLMVFFADLDILRIFSPSSLRISKIHWQVSSLPSWISFFPSVFRPDIFRVSNCFKQSEKGLCPFIKFLARRYTSYT